MTSHNSVRRLSLRSALAVAVAGVGLGGLALAGAALPRADAQGPGNAAPPPRGKAEEAPAGFDDPPATNGYVDQSGFMAARKTFL
jgi:hypothetical protein